ncbi:hypothetical protein D3C81_578170 [compost metagenome]
MEIASAFSGSVSELLDDRQNGIADNLGLTLQAISVQEGLLGGGSDLKRSLFWNDAYPSLRSCKCDFGLDAAPNECGAGKQVAHFVVDEAATEQR